MRSFVKKGKSKNPLAARVNPSKRLWFATNDQSSGSSFTIAAPWLLPNHTATGVVWSSM